MKSSSGDLRRAASDETLPSLLCISGSTRPGVGLWVSPSGQNLTESSTDTFTVTVGGEGDPGAVSLSLNVGEGLQSEDEGVYTCVIPDETDEIKVLHTGVYRSDFNSEFHPSCTVCVSMCAVRVCVCVCCVCIYVCVHVYVCV